MDKHSPTPWRVVVNPLNGELLIKESGPGISLTVGNMFKRADAEFLVEAVNGVDATLKLQRTLLGWSIERVNLLNSLSEEQERGYLLEEERDRLRDVVRRLADIVRHDCDERAMAVTREAYAALGEEVPE